MNDIKFKTYAEIKQHCPISRVIWSKTIRRAENIGYANKIDLELLRKYYGTDNVQILDGSWVKCWFDDTRQKIVEGYIFDGEYWYPAYNTHDGWVPYNEDDLID